MKIIAYIICYLIYPFSFVLPRNKKKWAFGTSHYAFNDNAKYLFLYASEHSDNDCAWLTFNRKVVRDIRSKGLKAYSLLSPQGIWFALTSGYWFFNSYVSDILFCLSGRAKRVNLWHGVPIKQIEFDITSGPLVERYVKQTFRERFYNPQNFCRPDFILAPSERFVNIFSSAFRMPKEHCLQLGIVPRNYMLVANESDRQSFIERYETPAMKDLIALTKRFTTTYIYMPTWRESQREIFTQSMDLQQLNEVLKKTNALLLLKPHVNTRVDHVQDFSNIRFIDSKMDVYPLMPYTDVLITDYSSVMYDYMLMEGKTILYYLYDYDEYKQNERDFYYSFDENTIGDRVYSYEELKNKISCGVSALDSVARQKLLRVFWGDTIDEKANDRVIQYFK